MKLSLLFRVLDFNYNVTASVVTVIWLQHCHWKRSYLITDWHTDTVIEKGDFDIHFKGSHCASLIVTLGEAKYTFDQIQQDVCI